MRQDGITRVLGWGVLCLTLLGLLSACASDSDNEEPPPASNTVPVAVDDSATTAEDNAVTIAVLANDSDRDNDTLTVSAVTQGRNGTVSSTGRMAVYTPSANFFGTDSFTYTIGDGRGGTATATVVVTVTPVNDPPVAMNDTATTAANTASAPIAVLANDTDVEGNPLRVAAVSAGSNGSTTTDGTTITYTPNAGFVGTDLLTYTLSDGAGGMSTATVTVTVTPPPQPMVAVNGQVQFDSGAPVEGATIMVGPMTATAMNAIRSIQNARQVDMTRVDAQNRKPSQPTQAAGAALLRIAKELQRTNTMTDAAGRFATQVPVASLPSHVLVEIRFQPPGFPLITSARMVEATSATLDIGTVIVPAPQGSEITLQNGQGQSADGAVRISGLPSDVTRLFARSYDPSVMPDAFPGSFQEMAAIPLNSALFLWVEGLDANGGAVDTLSQMATFRVRVPTSQWTDLEDINTGTDRIEVPIYIFNETTNMWEQRAEVGWLEDAQGTVLPEDAQSVILNGTFPGELFATFPTNHLSWFNVDYAFIGPWTLSRLDRNRRNDDCLFRALQLARTIARSAAGRQAYAPFNVPGGDLDMELADAAGPELRNTDLTDEYGHFRGNEEGDQDDQFYMDNDIWNGCAAGATDEQRRNTTLLMAVTILHETAHWKWDVIHEGGNWQNPEPGGEAGNTLERSLFGGIITDGNGINRDRAPLDNATRDQWLDPANWPPPPSGAPRHLAIQQAQAKEQGTSPLRLTLTLPQQVFDLGADLPVTVTYENVSTAAISVLTLGALEGYPLWFTIIRQGETVRVPFRGGRAKRIVQAEHFRTLQPGERLQQEVNLVRDPVSGAQRYNLITSGEYQLTAFYSEHWGLPQTMSNTLTFTLNPGGAIAGLITNATTSTPVAGATVEAFQGTNILATAMADATGRYRIPELPQGTYRLVVRAPGLLRVTRENVSVRPGATTIGDFSLSPLLAAGELRFVLTWGATPRDLDSHLWLPLERPLHVAYFRRGALEDCPFAFLDVDDTSGLGPETITVRQRFAGTYLYAIHNFSGSPALTASAAQVQVFDASGLRATFNVPTTGQGLWWRVLTFDGATGQITEINTLGDDPAPYADTAMGCTVVP